MFWKKKLSQKTDLLELAIESASKNSEVELESFCVKYQEEIKQNFGAWKIAPEKYRVSPEMVQLYGNAVLSVAQIFSKAGDESLINVLTSKNKSNPVDEWHKNLEVAQELQNSGKYEESTAVLDQTLKDNESLLGGTGVQFYMPRTYGLLGTAHYRLGNIKLAIECMQKAKSLCEDCGDVDGVRTYQENLDHIVQNA